MPQAIDALKERADGYIEFDPDRYVTFLRDQHIMDGLQYISYKEWAKANPQQTPPEVLTAMDILSLEGVGESLADFTHSIFLDKLYDFKLSAEIYNVDAMTGIQARILPVTNDAGALFFILVDPFVSQTVELLNVWGDNKEFQLLFITDRKFKEFVETESYTHDLVHGTVSVKSKDEIQMLLEKVLLDALDSRASDLRFLTGEKGGEVIFRVDGDLQHYTEFDEDTMLRLHEAIENPKITEVQNTNIFVPRTGIMRIQLRDEEYELRCNFLMTKNSRDTNLRFMYKDNFDLNALGLTESRLNILKGFNEYENGLVLLTGPTGCGKSTTLYSLLDIARHNKGICTVEDPVEHRMPGLAQLDVTAAITFEDAIQSFLRHDPDIIVVGECRSKAVAGHLMTAANTGHLTYSSLHTNNAISAIARLRDLEVSNVEICDNLLYVVAQRLVKRVCPECAVETVVSRDQLIAELGKKAEKYFDADSYTLLSGVGCPHCRGTGTYGRCLTTEILRITDSVREQIMDNASIFEISKTARDNLLSFEEEIAQHLIKGVIPLKEAIKGFKRVGA